MTNAGRNATVALVAAAAMMVAGRANAQDEPTAAPGLRDATIVLHAVNYAALSREVLDVAKARVAMVYELIGVRIEWVDGEGSFEQRQDGRRHFSILLLSRDMAEKKIKSNGIKDGVLGQAHMSSGRASHLLRSHRGDARRPDVFRDPARRRHRPRSRPSLAGCE